MKRIKIKQKKNNQTRGFTLIETFVAITILMIVVLGPMSLLSNALKNARYIGDEITATFLAQEGVEIIIADRNRRGTLLVEGTHSDCDLRLNENSGGYQCDGRGRATVFNRKIEIKESRGGPGYQQYKIISTVTRSNFLNREIVSRSIIFKY